MWPGSQTPYAEGVALKRQKDKKRKLDIYFKESLYISMAEKYDDKVIFGQYISKINSLPQNKGRTFENSDLLDLEKEEKEKQVAYERYKASSEFDLVRI